MTTWLSYRGQQAAWRYVDGRRKGNKWISYDPAEPERIPDCAGCYVVLVKGIAVYVGQSLRVRHRIGFHDFRVTLGNSTYIPWEEDQPYAMNDVVVKVKFGKKYGDWLMREARLIRRLKPKYNCVTTGGLKPKKKRLAIA